MEYKDLMQVFLFGFSSGLVVGLSANLIGYTIKNILRWFKS